MKSIFVWLEFRIGSTNSFTQVFEVGTFGPEHEHFKTGADYVQAIQKAHRSAGSTLRILNIVIEG